MTAVETIGVARSLGWRIHMRCAWGRREGLKTIRACVYRKELELETLVCTRGEGLPAIESRKAPALPGVR